MRAYISFAHLFDERMKRKRKRKREKKKRKEFS
jgi:hypothetical protein